MVHITEMTVPREYKRSIDERRLRGGHVRREWRETIGLEAKVQGRGKRK